MKKLMQKIVDWKRLEVCIAVGFIVVGAVFFFFQSNTVLNALAPECVSIGITIFVVDRIIKRGEIKRELIKNMGGKSNDHALMATRILRSENWLFDGSLEKKDFGWAELHRADLSRAEMTKANFEGANLSKTNLACAILKNAILTNANLEGANLALANLEGAKVSNKQLKSALRNYLIGTTMPDGTKLQDPGEDVTGKITGVDCERKPNLEGPTFEEWLSTHGNVGDV